jgi:hypothetical protein
MSDETHVIRRFWILIGMTGLLIGLALFSRQVVGAAPHQSAGLVAVEAIDGQGPALPLTATLTMPTVPGVGEPAPLFIRVGAVQDAPDTSVELILPESVTLVEGPQHWQVDLFPGETQMLSTTLRFDQTGEYELLVELRKEIDANNALIGEGALAVTIREDSGQTGFALTPTGEGEQVPVTPSTSAVSTPSPKVAPPMASPTPVPATGGTRCLGTPLTAVFLLGMVAWHKRRR